MDKVDEQERLSEVEAQWCFVTVVFFFFNSVSDFLDYEETNADESIRERRRRANGGRGRAGGACIPQTSQVENKSYTTSMKYSLSSYL